VITGTNFIILKRVKMEKSFGLSFHLKKSKYDKEKKSIVYMRITVDSEVCDVSTKRKCDSKKWNKISGRMSVKEEGSLEFNSYIDTLQQKVFEAKRKLLELDKPVTPQNIKSLLLGRSINRERRMLMEIFKYHNDQMEALVGKEYAAGTLQRYETSLRHTGSFLESRYKVSDLDIRKLDFEFISEYEFWLKSSRKCDHNSSMKYLSNFRKIVNRCLRSGWLEKDPFIGFKMTKREVERTALTEKELQIMAEKPFSFPRLVLVRDIFLFSCYTGLAYADVKKLRKSEIITGQDNEKWLVSKRQKTDISARIPLLPAALSLIEQYKNHPQCLLDDRVLPVLSNQKMNAYLKEIADVCGISKTLTYHIARHTFATTVTLSNGVPIETVSKMLGHRNLKTTQHYAKILDLKVSMDMKQIREKYK
jgi:site-specific recombinase XerD